MGMLLNQMTPAILAITTQVVAFLAGEARKQLEAEGTGLVGDFVKAMFKRFRAAMDKSPPPGVSVTPELLSRVRETTLQNASRLHLPRKQATVLANAVVGSLSLSPAG
jgi:hypothetical protein